MTLAMRCSLQCGNHWLTHHAGGSQSTPIFAGASLRKCSTLERTLNSCRQRECCIRCMDEKAESQDGEGMESLFAKELKKRAIADGSSSPRESSSQQPGSAGGWSWSFLNDSNGSSTSTNAPKLSDKDRKWAQLVKSEGFDGLVPRATELLKLGSSLLIPFSPLLLAIALLSVAGSLALGSSFIHGGNPHSGPPPYVDPYELLREEAVDDPMVPLR